MNAYKEYDSYLSLSVEPLHVIHKSVEDYAHWDSPSY